MQVAPPRHDLRAQFGGEPLHIGSQRIRASGRLRLDRDGEHQRDQQEGSQVMEILLYEQLPTWPHPPLISDTR